MPSDNSEGRRIESWAAPSLLVVQKSKDAMKRIDSTFDFCLDATGPKSILSVPDFVHAYYSMRARGVNIRIITEINLENVVEASEVMKFADIRHIDGIVGNFGIADRKEYYVGSPDIEDSVVTKLTYSRSSSEFVKQQQFFFDTLWRRAVPAREKIAHIQEGREAERTEVWRDQNTIISKSIEVLSKVKEKYDFCTDSKGLPIIVNQDFIKKAYMDIVSRGGRIRLITEINEENIYHCREMSSFVEIRHFDHIKGSFGIVDGKIYAGTSSVNEREGITSYLYSNVREFVDQQQYFFETLWDKAIPAELKIRQMLKGIQPEIIEIVSGPDNIMRRVADDFSRALNRVDACCDSSVPGMIVNSSLHTFGNDFVRRGGKIRLIVDIIPENIEYVKELMKTHDVRHIAGNKANFGVSDSNFSGPAFIDPSFKNAQYIFSNSTELIRQHQSLFENLWSHAIPAEIRIQEIEKNIVDPERTEVWYSLDNTLQLRVNNYKKVTSRMDACIDSSGPSMILGETPLLRELYNIAKQGITIRIITDINANNLSHCKELAKFSILRHLDGVKGNFIVSDVWYQAYSSDGEGGRMLEKIIFSSMKGLVEQQQYFFETLWDKAIPAEKKIKDLEEGKEPETLELIQETRKSINRAFEVISKTKEELLVLFASPNVFALALTEDVIQLYKDVISHKGAKLKFLVPGGKGVETQISKLRSIIPSVDIRISDANLSPRITIMVSDRKRCMSWELRDDTSNDPYAAGGIATFSNITSLAESYGIIFDNLWKLNEFADNLQRANLKLESNEKAMKDFINIAAHELRTPVQPILGLSEMLLNSHGVVRKRQQLADLDVILRNARRLERLAEDILDVARIESGKLNLVKERLNLGELVETAVQDAKSSLVGQHKVELSYQYAPPPEEMASSENEPIVVFADPEKLIQVILNLLSNAIRFSPENGRVKIRVSVDNAEKKKEKKIKLAIVSIEDEGPGLELDLIPSLFKKFVTSSQKGTGLGLFISKSIVEAHGGRVWAENNPNGRGAMFSFSIPMVNI
jgi:two-component system, OmpR family, sensor histidine kinase VicK